MTLKEQSKKAENIIDLVSPLMRRAEILPVQEFKESAIDAFSPPMKTKHFSAYTTELTLNTMVHYLLFLAIPLKSEEHLEKKKIKKSPVLLM